MIGLRVSETVYHIIISIIIGRIAAIAAYYYTRSSVVGLSVCVCVFVCVSVKGHVCGLTRVGPETVY